MAGMRLIVASGVLVLATACGPTPTPSPTPATFPSVGVTPAVAPRVLAWAEEYRRQVGPLPVDLEIVQAPEGLERTRRGDYAALLGAVSPPEGWFATPLAVEPIAIVITPGLPVRDLSAEQIAALMTGRTASWSGVGGPDVPVQPIVPLSGDDLRQVFETEVMAGAPITTTAFLAASPQQAIDKMKADDGAITIVPLSSVPAGLTPISIAGVGPNLNATTSTYPLTMTILATAPTEPTGAARDFLVWLQTTYPRK